MKLWLQSISAKKVKTKLRSQNVHVRNVLFNYIIISINKDKITKQYNLNLHCSHC